VGRSGHAAFPHLHFALRRSGELVDPFTGTGAEAGCGGPREPQWSPKAVEALRYRAASIFDAGIAGGVLTPAAAYGEAEAPPARRESEALVAWAVLFGVRAGDELQLSLLAADGTVLARNRRVLERNQARYFVYAGRKRAGELWPAGEYRVEVELVRALPGGVPYRTEWRTSYTM
jgi:hypothetical protein